MYVPIYIVPLCFLTLGWMLSPHANCYLCNFTVMMLCDLSCDPFSLKLLRSGIFVVATCKITKTTCHSPELTEAHKVSMGTEGDHPETDRTRGSLLDQIWTGLCCLWACQKQRDAAPSFCRRSADAVSPANASNSFSARLTDTSKHRTKVSAPFLEGLFLEEVGICCQPSRPKWAHWTAGLGVGKWVDYRQKWCWRIPHHPVHLSRKSP